MTNEEINVRRRLRQLGTEFTKELEASAKIGLLRETFPGVQNDYPYAYKEMLACDDRHYSAMKSIEQEIKDLRTEHQIFD